MPSWMILCASLMLWLPQCICQQAFSWGVNKKLIPVQLQGSDGNEPVVRYVTVDLYRSDLSLTTHEFCEEHNVNAEYCMVLYNHVRELVSQEQKRFALPNPSLNPLRYRSTADAERSRVSNPGLYTDFSAITASEDRVVELLKRKWAGHQLHRLSFLHSCQVTTHNDTHILERLLRQISESGLLNTLDTLVVLNYGPVISQEVKDQFSYKIEWIQVHQDIMYFEIPSLRILHRMVKHLGSVQPDNDPQVLYLHTKGVSYTQIIPAIQDWTDLMMYFLVEKHDTCLHLLQSGEVDCVGTLLHSTSHDLFKGNFWWATGAYLAGRPELRYEDSAKYEAEFWLLRYSHARVFVLHYNDLDLYTTPYPPSCYVPTLKRNDSLCGGPPTVGFPKYVEIQ